MTNEEDVARIVLAQLVDSMGGVATLDVELFLEQLKQGKFKRLELKIVGKLLRIEVFDDEDTSETAEQDSSSSKKSK